MNRESDHTIYQENERFELMTQAMHGGVFEIRAQSDSFLCSTTFCELLGVQSNAEIPSKSFFLAHLVFPADKEKLEKAISDCLEEGHPFTLKIKLKHVSGQYKWFHISGQAKTTASDSAYIMCIITDIDERIQQKLALQRSEFLLEETSKMAKVGGWELYTRPHLLTWSKEVCIIHEVPEDFKPDLDSAINFYSPSYIPIIEQAVDEALSFGKAFDLELKIITATKKEIWVRAIGKPILQEESGNIVGVRGVFQDINEQKEKELAIAESTKTITSQNKRLVNFAHIVSHNLRSHAANLTLTLELEAEETDPEQKAQLQENIRKISESLNETIKNLNELVVAQSETREIKKRVNLNKIMRHIQDILQADIVESQATLKVDFSKCAEIDFVPAYLESALFNLTSNAIKYRNPKVPLIIEIESDVEAGKPILKIRDNGLGIDLEKHGDKLFGMYKTFHGNENARGIGLFITKNQLESLGGKIVVQSEPSKGTQFKIHF
ncbi:MAG: PAS domain-containing protein [Sphingobacteriaceae bacterium]